MPPINFSTPGGIGLTAGSGVSAGGGGQTLGLATGRIVIDVQGIVNAAQAIQAAGGLTAKAASQVGNAAKAQATVQVQSFKVSAAAAQAASKSQIAAHNTIASGARASSKIQISANNQAVSNAQTNSKSMIAMNNQVLSNLKVTSAQTKVAYTTQTQAGRQAAQAQNFIYNSTRQAASLQTQQINQVTATIRQQIATARLAGVQQRNAGQVAATGWTQFSATLKSVRVELLAISAVSALMGRSGIQYAASMQEAEIQLEAMTGSAAKANSLMERLRSQARKAGIPFQDMTTFATQLLPVLNKDTNELDKWFDIVRRTAVLNRSPQGGIQGAAFSLREAFLSVQQGGRDFVSLADRFNISKKLLQESIDASGGDFVKAIDAVLTKMGITTEMADKMGRSFNASFQVAQDAAMQLIAAGFGPLIDVLGGMLQATADWLNIIRETYPELLTFGSGVIALVAIGGPLLLLINQLTIAWGLLGTAAQSAILKMLGIAGVAIAAYTLGKNLGTAIGGTIRQVQGKQPLSTEQVNQNAAVFVFEGIRTFTMMLINVEKALSGFASSIVGITANLFRLEQSIQQKLADTVPFGPLHDAFQLLANAAGSVAFSLENRASQIQSSSDAAQTKQFQGLVGMAQGWGLPGYEPKAEAGEMGAGSKYNEQQTKRIAQYSMDTTALNKKIYDDLLAENTQYGEDRTSAERDYNKQALREAQDFARSRALAIKHNEDEILSVIRDSRRQQLRWAEDLARGIAKAQEESADRVQELSEDHADTVEKDERDSAKRLEKMRGDLDDKIEKDRIDSIKKVAEIEKDFNKDREKAQRDHAEKLFSAAAQFDAYAIAREQREYAKQQLEANESHRERIADERNGLTDQIEEQRQAYKKSVEEEKVSLAEKLAEEQKSYEKRLKEEAESLQKSIDQQNEANELRVKQQKEDDDLRIQEIISRFNEQMTEEDNERRIRLDRTREDHDAQMAEMDRVHGLRITQINTQAAAERQALDYEFGVDLVALGVRIDAFQNKMKGYETAAVTSFDNVWKHMLNQMGGIPGLGVGTQWPSGLSGPPPAAGGSMLGLIPGGGTNIGTYNNIQGSTVNINIYPSPSQSPSSIGDAVIDSYLKRLGPPGGPY